MTSHKRQRAIVIGGSVGDCSLHLCYRRSGGKWPYSSALPGSWKAGAAGWSCNRTYWKRFDLAASGGRRKWEFRRSIEA